MKSATAGSRQFGISAFFRMVLGLALFAGTILTAAAQSSGEPNTNVRPRHTGPGNILVTPKFGGYLLGYGIDPKGTEGLLSEYLALKDGKNFIATETFDQKTGKILKVLAKKNDTQDNYFTWSIYGDHVGLDEFYQSTGNTFPILDPLNGNKFTGTWTPPIPEGSLLWSVRDDQSSAEVGVLFFDIDTEDAAVFSSNIAKNTFGSVTVVNNVDFQLDVVPAFAYDSKTNQAILAGKCPNCTPEIGLVDLSTGKIKTFTGVGNGYVNGLAVDSKRGIAVSTTTSDNGVEFYNLAEQTGFEVPLPCAQSLVAEAGGDVEFDAMHNLFLVQQTFNSCDSFSRLYVYDEKGNLKETLTGFEIWPVSPIFIALNPGNRSGFVYQNRLGETLQSFNY